MPRPVLKPKTEVWSDWDRDWALNLEGVKVDRRSVQVVQRIYNLL